MDNANKQEIKGIFKTSSKSNTVKFHAVGCSMLNTGNERRGIYIIDGTPAKIQDLEEQGYKPVYCKCTKA